MVLQARLSHYWQAQAGQWPHPWLPPHPVTGAKLTSLAEFDFPAYRQAHRAEALAATARSFDAAVAVARDWRPDLVVHDRLSLEGLLAARVTGVPAALHLWGPVGIDEPGALRLMPGDPSGSFERHGVGEMSVDLVERVIDPCPDDLRPAVGAAKRLDVRYFVYNGPVDAGPPADLAQAPSRARVCVVWGTSVTTMVGPKSFVVPQLLSTLDSMDVEVVVLLSATDRARLAAVDQPWPSVRVLTGVALERVLPSCAAVIHHGGAGCTMTSVAAGVPQLAVTFAGEQTANGQRVAATGAGIHIPGHELAPDPAREAVAMLLSDPAYAAAAQRLRTQHEQRPNLDALAKQLLEMACCDQRHPGAR